MDQFTRTTALELASHKVRCNSVNPGVIKTEVHKRGGISEEEYAKVRVKIVYYTGLYQHFLVTEG